MSIYSDKLANVQVVINCGYSIAQMRTWEDIHTLLIYSDKLAYIQVVINC